MCNLILKNLYYLRTLLLFSLALASCVCIIPRISHHIKILVALEVHKYNRYLAMQHIGYKTHT